MEDKKNKTSSYRKKSYLVELSRCILPFDNGSDKMFLLHFKNAR